MTWYFHHQFLFSLHVQADAELGVEHTQRIVGARRALPGDGKECIDKEMGNMIVSRRRRGLVGSRICAPMLHEFTTSGNRFLRITNLVGGRK